MAAIHRTILVLSAGAPHSPLIAGALSAVAEKRRTFDVIYTSGGGALVGLLFVAGKRDDSLAQIVESSISDDIYRFFPVNYKVFTKPGPWARIFRLWAERLKLPPSNSGRKGSDGWPVLYRDWLDLFRSDERSRRLYNDWIDFCAAALAPARLSYFSQGLCEPLPFLEDLVDLDKLKKQFRGKFHVNAYNLTTQKMEHFDNKENLTYNHIRAALAFPFIYPPGEVKGQFYVEGAERDPLNLPELLSLPELIRGPTPAMPTLVVLMDIEGSLETSLLRPPRNLWDAYQLSIITPIVSLAKKNLEEFQKRMIGRAEWTSHMVKFEIPADVRPYILDWSYSNMKRLFDIGRTAGEKFLTKYEADLPSAP